MSGQASLKGRHVSGTRCWHLRAALAAADAQRLQRERGNEQLQEADRADECNILYKVTRGRRDNIERTAVTGVQIGIFTALSRMATAS